jgi:beta-phosphoglucomutase
MKRLKIRPRAVLFDMDGVIVDSMPYHFISWYEALRPYGIRVGCFDVYAKEGERWDRTLVSLFAQHKRKPEKKVLRQIFLLRQKIFKHYFKRFIFKGAPQLLACLKTNGHLLGLVSGTPAPEIQKILPRRIRDAFDVIVAGNNVRHGKPSPEPYLRAARSLGVRPDECIVVENAPLGIQSARRAGMYCIAITTSLPKEYLKGADLIVCELDEIAGFLDKSCAVKSPLSFCLIKSC